MEKTSPAAVLIVSGVEGDSPLQPPARDLGPASGARQAAANRVLYALASPAVVELWRSLRRTAEEHVSGLERVAAAYVGDRSTLTTLTRDELRDRLRQGDLVVIDTRPPAEYAAGHIAGAVSMPVSELRSRLGEVADAAQVVAYCRGPYCIYADEAVRVLRDAGIPAARLEDGFPEWASAGLPVSAGGPATAVR